MYNRTEHTLGFKLKARDGEIGAVKDFLFDDTHWTIRHLVVDTGKWLPGRSVLISPYALEGILNSQQLIQVNLTMKQIQQSPSIDADKPVSRQMEEELHQYYDWPFYWQGSFIWGPHPYPRSYPQNKGNRTADPTAQSQPEDSHLRSTAAVTGYRIRALDDEFGHVEDFVFDDEDWAIRYLIIDTRNWWPGKKVLVAPGWVSAIDWNRSLIHVSLDQETVKRSPEYRSDQPITRQYEEELHQFYNREPYWRARMESVYVHQ